MRGNLLLDPFGPVVADNADGIVATHAELVHTEGEELDVPVIVGPGVDVPDAEVLLPQRDFAGQVGALWASSLGKVSKAFTSVYTAIG